MAVVTAVVAAAAEATVVAATAGAAVAAEAEQCRDCPRRFWVGRGSTGRQRHMAWICSCQGQKAQDADE